MRELFDELDRLGAEIMTLAMRNADDEIIGIIVVAKNETAEALGRAAEVISDGGDPVPIVEQKLLGEVV